MKNWLNADIPVGASMLAMDVNDDAGILDARGALEIIASMLAATGDKPKKPQSL
jgi:hypothetical protein